MWTKKLLLLSMFIFLYLASVAVALHLSDVLFSKSITPREIHDTF